MPARLHRQPGIHCPTQNLLYAYRYEEFRFHWFTHTAPDLEKRDEAGTLLNIYQKRIFEELNIVITSQNAK